MTNKLTNPVGYLQEFCQRYRTAKFPDYIELPAVGPDHSREFSCKCLFDGFEVSGKGIQKKQAKSDAAKNMLLLLEEKNYFDKFGISETDSCLSTGVQPAAQHITSSLKNPISALQEYCQQNKLMLPMYFESSSTGGFICECSLYGSKTFGEGSNKKTAKTESASKMCNNLGILFCGDGLEKNIKDENVITYGDKNAVSALEELCSQNKNLPKPVYESMPQFMNQFGIVCNVGTLSAEGRDTTKKGAKLLAASKMLGKLIMNSNGIGIKTELVIPAKNINEFEDDSLNHKLQRNRLPTRSILAEFPLDDSDEEDVKPSVDDLEKLKALESLSLEDSVVEVEPLTVTEQQKVEITSSENGAVCSASDSSERKLREDRASGSHNPVTDSDAIRQLEDNFCLLKVSGRVVIRSLTSSSILNDLQDQKVTLTGVVFKHKEQDLGKSLKLEINNLDTKRPMKDVSTQKTPTSESLLRWAQKTQS
uniref:DRBM domain-containing protein n=1 Tax=Homalodisca liturata TaxID=320908 RepID=A0A1B6JKH3_9HEMI